MNKYAKFWAALLGVALLITFRYFDWTFMGLETFVLELITGAATVFGVYQVRNAPANS